MTDPNTGRLEPAYDDIENLLVKPSLVKYIKLGARGDREELCIDENLIFIGFGTGEKSIFEAAKNKDWDDFAILRKNIDNDTDFAGTDTKATNAVKSIFEDDGNTLWITFHKDFLYWCFVDPNFHPERRSDLGGAVRKVKGCWQNTNIAGEKLIKQKLSGRLTSVEGFRGTVCNVKAADYLKRRINNNPSDNKKNLEDLRKKLYSTTKTLIQDLGWRDFELLVELLFSRTNWQKEDRVGGVEKTTDLKLFEPITRKNAFVQIKSAATQDIFDKYLIEHKGGAFKKMFFVYHTGHVRDYSGGEDVTIIGPEELGRRVIDAGLLDWLCDRVG